MQLPTIEFVLFFLCVFLIAAALRESINLYKYFLLLASAVFYLSWSGDFFLILAADIIGSFLLIKLMMYKKNKLTLFLTLFYVIAIWGVCKYYNFFIDSLLNLLYQLHVPANIGVLQIITPLGISFFTFRLISHIVDNYRGDLKMPSFLDFANYVAFFPQITAGPIAVAKDFYEDLNERKFQYDRNKVILLIILGFFKKFVLASILFDAVQTIFASPRDFSGWDLLIGALSYTMLIYVDFSGYSDLAIATSNLLGFRVPLNFNMPYRSTSLQEFWRRWHSSLGRWLKYYLYIPLGGSRVGTIRKYLNLVITMTFSGFWHGAGSNFIVWGFMHGIWLSLDQIIGGFASRVIDGLPKAIKPFFQTSGAVLSWAITFCFVFLTRIVFNTPTLEAAGSYYDGMIHPTVSTDVLLYDFRLWFVIWLVLMMNFVEIPLFDKLHKIMSRRSRAFWFIVLVIVLYILINLGPGTAAPFIYYKF